MGGPRVIVSQHFISAWERRIEKWRGRADVVSLILDELNSGSYRRRSGSNEILVVLQWKETEAYAIGAYNKHNEFVLKTVMNRSQVGAMGWKQNMKTTLAEMVNVKKLR